jgi:hypothetical protein
MSNLETYASQILQAEPVRVQRTEELNKKFTDIANEIYRCPYRNKNRREFKTVFESVEKMVIEHALSKLTGLAMNWQTFDHTNRDSYAWDVIDLETKKTFECKRWAEKWFSFNSKDISTFMKNVDIVDYFVSGKVFRTPSFYTVAFHLIADAKTFEKYVRPSQYTTKLYYDHHNACKKGDAFYRDHVYFEANGTSL